MKELYITTSIVVSYQNQFDVVIYNIQKPNKDNALPDYSFEYYNKIITQKKLNQKKKVEKSLTQLIKTVRSKEAD